jgi:hypothetical protein
LHVDPDVVADAALIADQYVSTGKTHAEARRGREGSRLVQGLLCSYEVPAANRAHLKGADATHLQPAQSPEVAAALLFAAPPSA